MREVVRAVQSARKEADLQVDDRIHLSLETSALELKKAVEEHAQAIADEVLASRILYETHIIPKQFSKTVKIEGHELTLTLKKA